MVKIYGFTEERAADLIEFIQRGRAEGKTLVSLFEEYGRAHGNSKGAIKNFYYELLKHQSDECVRRALGGREIHVGRHITPTEEEVRKIVNAVAYGKRRGLSMQKIFMTEAGGDKRRVMRMTNIYSKLRREGKLPKSSYLNLTVGEFVENFGEGKTFDFESMGGVDVWDDYDERCSFAFRGVKLTDEGWKKYASALALPCRIVSDGGSVIILSVHAETDDEAESIKEFVQAAAGYIAAEEYDRYFEEEKE